MIGQRVKELREDRGWNQSELASRAGLTPAAVSQIEGGRRLPTAQTLQKLADALGASSDALMGRESDEKLLERDEDARLLLRSFHELSDDDRERIKLMVKAFRNREAGGE